MADANRESLGYKIETTWGTKASGTKQLLPFTSCNLSMSNESKESAVIRSDGNVNGVIRTSTNVGGDVGFEVNYGAFDDFLRGVMRSDWLTALALTGTNLSFSGQVVTSASSVFTNVSVGQYVRISGATNSANNGLRRVTAKTATTITVAGTAFTTETAGATVTIKGQHMINGITPISYTIERGFEDITKYQVFDGIVASEFKLDIGLSDINKAGVTLLGKSLTLGTSAYFGSSTAAVSTPSMNSVDNIEKVFIDDATAAIDLSQFSITLTNNADIQRKIGTLDPRGIRHGYTGVSGSFSHYFQDNTTLTNLVNFTSVHLAIAMKDSVGNAYVFDFPEVKFNEAPVDNGGVNSDLFIPVGFTAIADPTLNYTVAVTRIAA
jgi:Phage tail tube protein